MKDTNIYPLSKALLKKIFHFPKVGYASSQEGSEGVDWLTQMMG